MSLKFFKSHFRLFLFAFLIAALSVNAFAWGDEGHHITVRIAASFLTPAARIEVIKLLKVDAGNNESYYKTHCPNVLALLKRSAFLTIPEGNTLLSDGLACVASWADPPLKRERPYTSNWHFVDIPVVMATSANPTLFTYDAARDCRTDSERGDCAIQALERFQPVLANFKNPAVKGHEFGEELTSRAEALKYFIHIIGDIHQPMHCATDKKSKASVNDPKDVGDMGGNLVFVTWFGVATTPFGANELHAVWDEGFIGRTMDNKKFTEAQYAQFLVKNISPDNLKTLQTQPANFRSWAGESYNLSVTNAYGKLPKIDAACKVMKKDNVPQTDRNGKPVMGCYRLSDDYFNANNPIVEQQLQTGGARLAGLLNTMFK
ncbi:MAG: S1/P1 nuclease [Pyrinomonadaceae bacterium]